MPKWKLGGHITVSCFTEVEADTAQEARQIAEQRMAVMGGVGAGADPTESWVVEDLDGEVDGIAVDED